MDAQVAIQDLFNEDSDLSVEYMCFNGRSEDIFLFL